MINQTARTALTNTLLCRKRDLEGALEMLRELSKEADKVAENVALLENEVRDLHAALGLS